MTRIAVLVVILAGCDVGTFAKSPDGGAGGDGRGADGNGSACANIVSPPDPQHNHAAGGGTNAGQNCMAAGCHLAGGAGPTYTFAGTVYIAGSNPPQPKTGVTIRV